MGGYLSAIAAASDRHTQRCAAGALVALELGVGLIELRKDPEPSTVRDRWLMARTPPDHQDRTLKLGLRRDLLPPGSRVLFVDDWIDTGGQTVAARRAVEGGSATDTRQRDGSFTLTDMVKGMGAVSEYATTVVRLFPDYADSVIWFRGPVSYEATHLDARLIADLQTWDATYYAGLSSDYSWRTPQLMTQFHAEGARLARRLADQLGDGFLVEYDLGESHRRVRGAGPARNPDAAAAFSRLADAAGEEWAELKQMADQAAKDGHTLEWRAD